MYLGTYVHNVLIDKKSLLYSILNKDIISVNSRHKSVIKNTSDLVCAYSDDVIEAIEDCNKKFYLGLQWHPENLYNTDINSRKIFDYFVSVCKKM